MTYYTNQATLNLAAFAVMYIAGTPLYVSVLKATCIYQLNNIPICRLRLAAGREAFSYLISNAHLAPRFVFQIPIAVYLRIGRTYGDPTGMLVGSAGGTFLLFAGFVTRVHYERRVQELFIDVECIHWLHLLNFSSALSETSHPANPSDLIFNAFVRTGAGSRGGLTLADDVQSFITPFHVASDLWGNAILPWFMSLTRVNRMNSAAFFPPQNDTPNGLALMTLRSFMYGRPRLSIRTSYPLSFFLLAEIADTLAGRLSGWMRNTLDALAHTTLWHKLVHELAPTFYFAVVPLPGTANVVPFVPSLSYWWLPNRLSDYTIAARDIFSVRVLNKELQQPIRAVGLFGNIDTYTGSGLRTDPMVYNSHVGGIYVNPLIDRGLVIFERAPAYASTLLGASALTPYVLANRGSAWKNPGKGSRNISPGQVHALRGFILDHFAQWHYNYRVLANRNALITGPLRFDIAPGSTIAVESIGDQFIGGYAYSNGAIVGLVDTVIFDIDVNPKGPTASTSYGLAFVRTVAENLSGIVSMPFHPLYTTIHVGMPMLNGPF